MEEPPRCGVTRVVSRFEWICVRDVHDDPPTEHHGQRSTQPQHGYYPKSERHHFRRRYPGTER